MATNARSKVTCINKLQWVEEDEVSSSYEVPRLSYTEKGMRIANQPIIPRSFSMTRICGFQPKA